MKTKFDYKCVWRGKTASANNRLGSLFSLSRFESQVAVALGVVSCLGALVIGYLGYQSSISTATSAAEESYLERAEDLAWTAASLAHVADEKVLSEVLIHWQATNTRPSDAYICVVDANANLILHSAHPEMVGNAAMA